MSEDYSRLIAAMREAAQEEHRAQTALDAWHDERERLVAERQAATDRRELLDRTLHLIIHEGLTVVEAKMRAHDEDVTR